MLQLNGATLLAVGGEDASGNPLRTVEMYTGTQQWKIMGQELEGDFYNGGAVVIPN